MLVKSNTKGKIEKILKGTVFDNPTSFIYEIVQNSYRAKAKNVYFFIKDTKCTIIDDGCGLKNPDAILTFDYSEWSSTTEGFGIGIWSILNIPSLKLGSFESKKIKISFDVEKLKETLEVDVENVDTNINGFKITLESEYFLNEYENIVNTIEDAGKYLSFNIFINNKKIPQESILESIDCKDYFQYFENRLFKAKFFVSPNEFNAIKIYYEDRFVCDIYAHEYTVGVICVKRNALDFKEPDRKSIIYNEKNFKFNIKIDECLKILYKSFIRQLNIDDINFNKIINTYANAISYYLRIKDYSKILFIDKSFEKKEKTKVSITKSYKNEINEDSYENKNRNNVDESTSNSKTNSESESISNLEENNKTLKLEENNKTLKNVVKSDSKIITTDINNIKKTRTNIKDFLKNNKMIMWVNIEDIERYSDYISIAEYEGITVLKVRNVLYKNYLNEVGIKHISEINNYIKKSYIFKNVGCMTNKEKDFLLLLKPIIEYYNLEKECFKICNISTITKILLKDSVKKKVTKNSYNDIKLFAITNPKEKIIYFDRKALSLKNFNINHNFGINELKCIMYNLNTIAHELAHLLYGTIDNTPLHYKMEMLLMQEITEIYINL